MPTIYQRSNIDELPKKMNKENKIMAWHFLRSDKRLGYKDGRKVVKGRKMKCPPDRKIQLCEYGMHASLRLLDALSFVYWKNPIVCRVELSGDVIQGIDKIVAPERKVIAWCDADKLLHEFACRVAEDSLVHFEKRFPEDKRPRLAIEAKHLWLQGKISDEELRSARAAAADATAAADDATDDAATDAAAAATDAAYVYAAANAANAAAYAATAAEAAYVYAAADAAAARKAAKNKYNQWLTEMFNEALGLKEDL